MFKEVLLSLLRSGLSEICQELIRTCYLKWENVKMDSKRKEESFFCSETRKFVGGRKFLKKSRVNVCHQLKFRPCCKNCQVIVGTVWLFAATVCQQKKRAALEFSLNTSNGLNSYSLCVLCSTKLRHEEDLFAVESGRHLIIFLGIYFLFYDSETSRVC